jgi:PleD family two-component response regulator
MQQRLAFNRPAVAMIIGGTDWAAQSLESLLTPQGYLIMRGKGIHEATEQLSPRPPDIFLIDVPAGGAISDLCARLRRNAAFDSATPIVCTPSVPIARKERLAALRAGAWDVLPLPLENEEIVLKIDAFVRAKLAADKAREEALLDEATGFYNVRGLLRRVHEISSEARRHRRPMACVVVTPELHDGEADDEAVDAAVSFVGRTLRSFARSSDTVGRMSRTEFAVVAVGTDGMGARRLAHRLEETLTRQTDERLTAGHHFRLRSATFAVADAREHPVEPAELLVRTAMILRQSLS